MPPARLPPTLLRRLAPWIAAGLLGLGLWFRLAVIASWHAPAGDGMDYYALSQELRREGRYAYGPAPQPLSYARMPGYPLFLAYVAVRQAPVSLEDHLTRATRANVLCDLGTALLVFLLIRRLGWGPGAALLGLGLVILCPQLFLLSCYGLGESLATFLGLLELYLGVLALGVPARRVLVYAALAGVCAGLGELVRADAFTMAAAVLLALLTQRSRGAVAVFALAAVLVYAPWPVRNLVRFGHPYPAAAYNRTRDGTPLPGGFFLWARTWGSGEEGEAYPDLLLAMNRDLDPRRPAVLFPAMYDDAEERERVAELFRRYNRERLSPSVDEGFRRLACERLRRHPLRTLVTLPLRRIYHLWAPVDEAELPMRSALLKLPRHRAAFGWFSGAVYGLAFFGALLLLRRQRRLAAVLLSCIAARSLLIGYVIPMGVTQRLLVEVMPVLLLLAVYGVCVGPFSTSSMRSSPSR